MFWFRFFSGRTQSSRHFRFRNFDDGIPHVHLHECVLFRFGSLEVSEFQNEVNQQTVMGYVKPAWVDPPWIGGETSLRLFLFWNCLAFKTLAKEDELYHMFLTRGCGEMGSFQGFLLAQGCGKSSNHSSSRIKAVSPSRNPMLQQCCGQDPIHFS